MKKVDLVFYPRMKKAIEFYSNSPFYSGERIVSMKRFRESGSLKEGAVVLGRHGNFHHWDLVHIKTLREKGVLPKAKDTTVVLFDWHPDLDNDPKWTLLTSASWAYMGLERDLYCNIYIVGTHPGGIDELNPFKYEEEIRPPTGNLLRMMDRFFLFPSASSFSLLKFLPKDEHFLSRNESVGEHFVVEKGGFVAVRFKGMSDVDYRSRKEAVVVSIDLDVLKKSILKAICPQGIMETEELVAHLRRVQRSGTINAILICGLSEEQESQDEISLNTLSAILSEASALVKN